MACGSKRNERRHDLEANVAEVMNRRECGTRGEAAARDVGRTPSERPRERREGE